MSQLSVEQIVNEKIMLIMPRLSTWRGRYELKDDDTELLLEGKTVDRQDITTPSVKLFTKQGPNDPWGRPWMSRITEIATEFETAKRRQTLPYNLGVARILPANRLPQFLAFLFGDTGTPDNPNLGSFAERLNTIGREMADQYPELLDYWSRRDYWRQIRDRLPQKEKIAARFHVSVGTLNIGLTDGVREQLLEREASIVARTCRQQVHEVVAAIIEEPRRAILEEVAKLQSHLDNNVRFNTRSFNAVREAIDRFRMFEFVADDTVLEKIQELEKNLNVAEPRHFSDNAEAGASLREAIESIGKTVEASIERSVDNFSLDRTARFMD